MMRAANHAALVLVALVGCQPRSELILGFATDLKGGTAFDHVTLNVTRVSNDQPEGGDGEQWEVTGVRDMPVNLPASFGLYSDGEDLLLNVTLTGTKGADVVTSQRAVLSIVAGQTLFYRMGLTASCESITCGDTETCIEGTCVDAAVDPKVLPSFRDELVTKLSCASRTSYIDTGTGSAMPLTEDAGACPPDQCNQGTCLVGPTTRTVTGSNIVRYFQPSSTTNVPIDETDQAPEVLVADGSGGTRVIAGVGHPDGTFEIAGVPVGKYLLKLGSNYISTASSTLDLGYDTLGRPDIVVPTQTTSLQLNVTGLTAWATSDELQVYSGDASIYWIDLDQRITVAPGSTTLSATIANQLALQTSNTDGLIRLGDDLEIIQRTMAQTTEGIPYSAATKFFSATTVDQTNGGTASVTGAFVSPPTMTLTGTQRETLFDSAAGYDGTHLALLNPLAVDQGYTSLAVRSQPGDSSHGQDGPSVFELYIGVPHGPDRTATGMTFATPAAAGDTWTAWVEASEAGTVALTLPGASAPVQLNVFVETDLVLPLSGPVAPVVGPVTSPTVDGQDLFQAQTGVSTTPTLAWTASTVGAATMYRVVIHHLTVTPGGSAGSPTVDTVVGTLFTAETRITVPGGLMVSGEAYAIEVIAGMADVAAPNRNPLPRGFANIVSAVFVCGA